MIGQLHNNVGIAAVAIALSLRHAQKLSLSASLLVVPITSNRGLIAHLGRATTQPQTIEQLLVKNPMWFVNFNRQFYSSLPTSMNAIQLLVDLEMIFLDGGTLSARQAINWDSRMGVRASRIDKASKNIAALLVGNISDMYSNLRIAL